jgi:hypothetical protein
VRQRQEIQALPRRQRRGRLIRGKGRRPIIATTAVHSPETVASTKTPLRASTLRAAGPIALLAALGACGGASVPPTCRVIGSVEMPSGTLGDLGNARLDRAAEGFAILARSEDGGQVRFARLTPEGVMGVETTIGIPPRALGPVYAVTSKNVPGDQLLAVYGVADSAGVIALQIIAVVSGSMPAPPRPLLDPDGNPVVLAAPAADAAAPTLAMQSLPSGKRALVTWAAAGSTTAPRMLLLEDGGTTRAPVSELPDSASPSACLAITQSRLQFGISRTVPATAPGNRLGWLFSEFDEDGKLGTSFNLSLSTSEGGCPTVGPTPRGYTISWQTQAGTYFADVDTTRAGDFYTSNFLLGAVRFGGPDAQPPVAAVVSSGYDFSLIFDGPTPTIDRFSLYGVPQGGTLKLPGSRRMGPLSAWSTLATVFMTYLDRPDGRPTRRFTKVGCPASQPE